MRLLCVAAAAALLPMALTLNTRALAQPVPRQEVARLAERREVHAAFRWMQSHESQLRRWQLELVRIPAPPFGESKRADWLRERFLELGLEDVEIDRAGNVTGVRKGTNSRARLLAVTAHMDTVFPASTSIQTRTDGDRLLGPGVSDNAAGLVGLLALAGAMQESGIQHEAGMLFVANVGEEGEGDLRGIRHLFLESRYRNLIGPTLVLDGAGVESLVTMALASKRFEVTVRGPGGHSWSDFGNPNPIVILARSIAQFSETRLPGNPKTSFNIGVIEGGTSVNSIPESATVRVDIRSSSEDEIARLEKILREAVSGEVRKANDTRNRRKSVTFDMVAIGTRPGGELRPSARILQVVRAVDEHLGIRSDVRRASTDANIPISLGREALSIGAGGSGGGAHTLSEWFDANGRDLGLKRILLAALALTGTND